MEKVGPFLCSLALVVNGVRHSLTETEAPAANLWLEINWNGKNGSSDFIIRQKGCLCRVRAQDRAVCYGEGCFVFPRNITIPEDILDVRVKTTSIVTLQKDDLSNLSRLENLWIDANSNLKTISPRSFDGMVHLRNLSISYNTALLSLDPDTFVGLIQLEALRLVKNGFTNILDASQALQARYLPKILYLSLCENYFPIIDDKAFVPMQGTGLQELELVLCQITKIKPKALNVFSKLTKLRVGDNLVSEENIAEVLEQLTKHGVPLELLNLYNFGLRSDEHLTMLLATIGSSNISHLVLTRNHLETISAGLFPKMPNIETLDLREVSAVTVAPGALHPSILPKLKVLLLAGNRLSAILPGVLLQQLSFLDLSENSYSPTSYFDVNAVPVNATLNLTSIDLSYNRISTIRRHTFKNFGNLEVLGLKNVTLFYVSKAAFTNLSKLRVLNLEKNALLPFNQFHAPIFDSLINLEVLFLGECRISSFNYTMIFSKLTKLKHLDLRDNDLIHIDAQWFMPLVSLEGINLSENRIQSWMSRVLGNHTNMQSAILSGNRLHTISVAMIEDLAEIQHVDISNNPFSCDCWSFNQTILWLKSDGEEYTNKSVVTASNNLCNAPDSWREQPVSAFLSSEDSCLLSAKSVFTTPVYIFMVVLLAMATVLGGLAYYYRWYIRYWIFLARMSFYRRHGWLLEKNKVTEGDYKYDVFVSYSHEDRNFIMRLVAMLENQHPFLKLCVYERDFEVGTVISTTVMEKVSLSRRTLLVVSNAFAKSQWCMWELQLAESHRIFFRSSLRGGYTNDPLVIIKMGSIAECNMTPTLKFLLKSRIYLDWVNDDDPKKESAFWQKLTMTLSPRSEKSKNREPEDSVEGSRVASFAIRTDDQLYPIL